MRFIIRASSTGVSDSWVEVDSVKITSSDCK